MSSKVDLQNKLNEIGYQIGPFASKETLSNILRLHLAVLKDENLNVAKLSDVELGKNLMKHGLLVGPVINHTRPIYQRKLLEILTNEITEKDDDIDESIHQIDNENELYPNLSERENFSYDESMTIRNDYKANIPTRNTYRDDNSNEIRSRIARKSTEQQTIKINKDVTTTKQNNYKDKQSVATKNSGTFLYAGITIIVALIVFIFYFLFQK